MPINADQIRRNEQIAGGEEEAHAAQIEGRLANLHTCLPGIVASFDVATQTASVQPAIKRIWAEAGAVSLPLCVDVPVVFPGGGDFFLTFPVKPGDECLLVFSERCIDQWYVSGGVQPPADYRRHDLSDAFAIVGVNSQPRKLANVQTTGAELRTRDRSTYIRLENGTIHVKGNIVLEGDMTQTGDLTSTGIVTGQTDVIAAGKSGKGHTHGGVVAGNQNSAAPN